jgi:hypothetical protein
MLGLLMGWSNTSEEYGDKYFMVYLKPMKFIEGFFRRGVK